MSKFAPSNEGRMLKVDGINSQGCKKVVREEKSIAYFCSRNGKAGECLHNATMEVACIMIGAFAVPLPTKRKQ